MQKKNKIILKLNEKDNDGQYPLLIVSLHSNLKIFKLLINYVNDNNITLELNEKYKNVYPLLLAVAYYNIKMVQLLINYANKNNIRIK